MEFNENEIKYSAAIVQSTHYLENQGNLFDLFEIYLKNKAKIVSHFFNQKYLAANKIVRAEIGTYGEPDWVTLDQSSKNYNQVFFRTDILKTQKKKLNLTQKRTFVCVFLIDEKD